MRAWEPDLSRSCCQTHQCKTTRYAQCELNWIVPWNTSVRRNKNRATNQDQRKTSCYQLARIGGSFCRANRKGAGSPYYWSLTPPWHMNPRFGFWYRCGVIHQWLHIATQGQSQHMGHGKRLTEKKTKTATQAKTPGISDLLQPKPKRRAFQILLQ